MFVCIDDKHKIKVGEPGYPVSAVERGQEVIVSTDQTFVVGDHDFCKFSLVPSVVFVIDLPSSIDGSWYSGNVHVGVKDATFQASSAIRHATELSSCLIQYMVGKHILFVYANGGPDHRLNYFSVQLSLIALFLNLDIDVLVAGRTAPCNSWTNPVERMMSIINLVLQCIGVMREKGGEEFEKSVQKCNSLKELREAGIDQNMVLKSLQLCKDLLHNILCCLQLKEEKFQVFDAATDEEIQAFWGVLLLIEPELSRDDNKKALDSKKKLTEFIAHCCTFHKYCMVQQGMYFQKFFDI